jgi:signal transduction histidine kinase
MLGELKSRFVSMASHEFRNPLSTILSGKIRCKSQFEKGTEFIVQFNTKKNSYEKNTADRGQ